MPGEDESRLGGGRRRRGEHAQDRDEVQEPSHDVVAGAVESR
jgi:hypothetical protein